MKSFHTWALFAGISVTALFFVGVEFAAQAHVQLMPLKPAHRAPKTVAVPVTQLETVVVHPDPADVAPVVADAAH